MYRVTVYRVSESEHKAAEETMQASAVTVSESGDLHIERPEGPAFFGSTTWGHVEINRVPGRA